MIEYTYVLQLREDFLPADFNILSQRIKSVIAIRGVQWDTNLIQVLSAGYTIGIHTTFSVRPVQIGGIVSIDPAIFSVMEHMEDANR